MDDVKTELIQVAAELKNIAPAIHEIKATQAEQGRMLQKALRIQDVQIYRLDAVEAKQTLLNGRFFALAGGVLLAVVALVIRLFAG